MTVIGLTQQSEVIAVMVGIIRNNHGQILVAKRAAHRHMGGYWEFPGGKVEANESDYAALQRELKEEVGIDIHDAQHWQTLIYEYPEKTVELRVWQVQSFTGEARGCEQQAIKWLWPEQLEQYAFPPANQAIVDGLQHTTR